MTRDTKTIILTALLCLSCILGTKTLTRDATIREMTPKVQAALDNVLLFGVEIGFNECEKHLKESWRDAIH